MKMGKIGKIMMFVFMFGLLAGPVFSLVPNTQSLVSETQAAVATPTMPAAINVGAQDKTLEVVVQDIIKWVIGFIILLSVFFFAYGGILYMTAGGDETKVETGKKLLTGALLGLVIALLSWAIVSVIVKTIFGYS